LDGVRIVRSGGKYSVYSEAKKFYRGRFSRESYDLVVDEINTRPFFAPSFVGGGEKVVALIHQLAKEYWFYEVPFPLSYLGFTILKIGGLNATLMYLLLPFREQQIRFD